MAIATCWNCGAGLNGTTCQMCGAAQTANAPQSVLPGVPDYQPGYQLGQPGVGQASMSVRPPQPMYGQPAAPGYPQSGPYQPGEPYQSPSPPMYGSGSQFQASLPMYGSSGQPQNSPPMYVLGGQPQNPTPGYAPIWQQPGAMAGQVVMPQQPTAGIGLRLLLATIYGACAGIVGALIWAFFLNLTKLNISYLALGLGFLVGLGVVLGARGRHHLLFMGLAGVLGLLSFMLALYFRLSLRDAPAGSTNVFAEPFSIFIDNLKLYLQANPINYVYIVAVPVVAVFTTIGRTAQRIGRR